MLTGASFDHRPPLGSKPTRSLPARAAASSLFWRALSAAFLIAAIGLIMSDVGSWVVFWGLLAAGVILSSIGEWKDPRPRRRWGDGGGYDGGDSDSGGDGGGGDGG